MSVKTLGDSVKAQVDFALKLPAVTDAVLVGKLQGLGADATSLATDTDAATDWLSKLSKGDSNAFSFLGWQGGFADLLGETPTVQNFKTDDGSPNGLVVLTRVHGEADALVEKANELAAQLRALVSNPTGTTSGPDETDAEADEVSIFELPGRVFDEIFGRIKDGLAEQTRTANNAQLTAAADGLQATASSLATACKAEVELQVAASIKAVLDSSAVKLAKDTVKKAGDTASTATKEAAGTVSSFTSAVGAQANAVYEKAKPVVQTATQNVVGAYEKAKPVVVNAANNVVDTATGAVASAAVTVAEAYEQAKPVVTDAASKAAAKASKLGSQALEVGRDLAESAGDLLRSWWPAGRRGTTRTTPADTTENATTGVAPKDSQSDKPANPNGTVNVGGLDFSPGAVDQSFEVKPEGQNPTGDTPPVCGCSWVGHSPDQVGVPVSSIVVGDGQAPKSDAPKPDTTGQPVGQPGSEADKK